MNRRVFNTASAANIWAINSCLTGSMVGPRELDTFEDIDVSFVISRPRNRIIQIENRKWSHALAIGELCWHLRGDDTVEPLTYYIEKWKEFSDDGHHISGSCYGYHIFKNIFEGESQWSIVKKILKDDIYSRRAVISIPTISGKFSVFSKDVPCLQSLQFLYRDGSLNLCVRMRSNDVYIGLPYDLYVFTFLLELMAADLNLNVGSYFHSVGSFHLYARDIGRVACLGRQFGSGSMGKIRSFSEIDKFLLFEEKLRIHGIAAELNLSEPWMGMARSLVAFHQKRIESGAPHPSRAT